MKDKPAAELEDIKNKYDNLKSSYMNGLFDLKQAEKALRESEEKYQFIFDNSLHFIWIYDYDTLMFLSVNAAAIKQYGYSKQEFLSMTVNDLQSIEHIDDSMKEINSIDSLSQLSKQRHLKKNGELMCVEIVSHPIFSDNNRVVHSIILDVTKSNQTLLTTENIPEQRNVEAEPLLFSRLVQQNATAICVTDPDGIIEYVNSPEIDLSGYSMAELIGSHSRIFSSGFNPKDVYIQLWKTIKSGNVWAGYLLNKKKTGELYWEYLQISPILDDNGNIINFSSLKLDLTDKKKMHEDMILAKESAEKSEILLRTFIENMPFEIWARDMNSVGILENKMHIDHFGTILGQKLINSNDSNNDNLERWESHIKMAMNGDIIHDEVEYKIDQQEIIYQQIAFPIYRNKKVIGVAGMNIDITTRRLAEKALISSEEQLKKFASHLQNVREEEKGALAREIHDDLGQILIALKIDIGLLKQKIKKDISSISVEDILLKFNNLDSLVDDTLKSARRIMNELRHEQLELLGLELTIKEYLISFEKRHQLKCEFVNYVSKIGMNQQQTLALFRILQEALTNIVKHAKATAVMIVLGNYENKLFLEISDDGVGFDMNINGRIDSYGMIGMRERAFLLKGELSITSNPGEGTRVRVEIPY